MSADSNLNQAWCNLGPIFAPHFFLVFLSCFFVSSPAASSLFVSIFCGTLVLPCFLCGWWHGALRIQLNHRILTRCDAARNDVTVLAKAKVVHRAVHGHCARDLEPEHLYPAAKLPAVGHGPFSDMVASTHRCLFSSPATVEPIVLSSAGDTGYHTASSDFTDAHVRFVTTLPLWAGHTPLYIYTSMRCSSDGRYYYHTIKHILRSINTPLFFDSKICFLKQEEGRKKGVSE